jgi:hypothetical protein
LCQSSDKEATLVRGNSNWDVPCPSHVEPDFVDLIWNPRLASTFDKQAMALTRGPLSLVTKPVAQRLDESSPSRSLTKPPPRHRWNDNRCRTIPEFVPIE